MYGSPFQSLRLFASLWDFVCTTAGRLCIPRGGMGEATILPPAFPPELFCVDEPNEVSLASCIG